MRKMNFTNRALTSLNFNGAANAKAVEYSDTSVIGLKIEVYQSGRKVFYFRYTFDGKKQAIRIGEYPAIGVEEARKTALQYRADVDRSVDPKAEKQKKDEELTFEQFANEHYLPHAEIYKRSISDDKSKLRLHIVPRWGKSKLTQLSKLEIAAFHGSIKESHTPATANRHLALIKRMLGLAVEWGYLSINPALGIKMFKESNTREQYLTQEEGRRFLAAMEHDRNQIACAALKLLLLTGVRRQEALSAKWADVDLDTRIWLLPKTKSGKARRVMLSDALLNLLEELGSGANSGPTISPYLFPGRDPSRPLVDPKKTLLRLLKAAGIDKPMRIHDLRHTFASLLVTNNTSIYTVQQLLGHASVSTTQRYAHLNNDVLRQGVQKVGEIFG